MDLQKEDCQKTTNISNNFPLLQTFLAELSICGKSHNY